MVNRWETPAADVDFGGELEASEMGRLL